MLTTLVIDASAAVHLATTLRIPAVLGKYRCVAPHLLWAECLAAIRQAEWRGVLPSDAGAEALRRLEALSIEPIDGPEHRARALDLARRLGWAKTYDAQYVALAESLDAPLLSTDSRLRRGAAVVIRTLGPAEL